MHKMFAPSVRFGCLAILCCGALLGCRKQINTSETVEEFKFDNLKKLNLGFRAMQTNVGVFPVDIKSKDGKALLSWRVAILPHIGEKALYGKFKLDEPWDSTHNMKLIDSIPEVYRIAGAKRSGIKTRLLVAVGPGTPHEKMEKYNVSSITDGLAKTIMAVEAGPKMAVEWTKPGDLNFNPGSPWDCVGDVSKKGLPVVFYDGKTMYLPEDLKDTTLRALFQCADGTEVNMKELQGN